MQGMEFSDYLVLAAAGAFVLGYLIINQVILRLMLLLGTALYIWYYAVVAETPLWPAIWASTATGMANVIGLFSLWIRNSPLSIPRLYKDIYAHFDILPPGDFRKLMRAAKRNSRPSGYELTHIGRRVNIMYYVVNGGVNIDKNGDIFTLPDGIFLGEVAYLTGNRASATTWLSQESDVLEWDIAMMKRRAASDVRFRLAMDAMISLDLAGKVARAGSPKAERQDEEPEICIEKPQIMSDEVLNLAHVTSK